MCAKSGPCALCGTGYCCRRNWKKGENGCTTLMGGEDQHVCVSKPKVLPGVVATQDVVQLQPPAFEADILHPTSEFRTCNIVSGSGTYSWTSGGKNHKFGISVKKYFCEGKDSPFSVVGEYEARKLTLREVIFSDSSSNSVEGGGVQQFWNDVLDTQFNVKLRLTFKYIANEMELGLKATFIVIGLTTEIHLTVGKQRGQFFFLIGLVIKETGASENKIAKIMQKLKLKQSSIFFASMAVTHEKRQVPKGISITGRWPLPALANTIASDQRSGFGKGLADKASGARSELSLVVEASISSMTSFRFLLILGGGFSVIKGDQMIVNKLKLYIEVTPVSLEFGFEIDMVLKIGENRPRPLQLDVSANLGVRMGGAGPEGSFGMKIGTYCPGNVLQKSQCSTQFYCCWENPFDIAPGLTIVFPFMFNFAMMLIFPFSPTKMGMGFNCLIGKDGRELSLSIALQFDLANPLKNAFYMKITNFRLADIIGALIDCAICVSGFVDVLLQVSVKYFEVSINPTPLVVNVNNIAVQPGIEIKIVDLNLWNFIRVNQGIMYAGKEGLRLKLSVAPITIPGILTLDASEFCVDKNVVDPGKGRAPAPAPAPGKPKTGTLIDLNLSKSGQYLRICGSAKLLGGLLALTVNVEISRKKFFAQVNWEILGFEFKVTLEGPSPNIKRPEPGKQGRSDLDNLFHRTADEQLREPPIPATSTCANSNRAQRLPTTEVATDDKCVKFSDATSFVKWGGLKAACDNGLMTGFGFINCPVGESRLAMRATCLVNVQSTDRITKYSKVVNIPQPKKARAEEDEEVKKEEGYLFSMDDVLKVGEVKCGTFAIQSVQFALTAPGATTAGFNLVCANPAGPNYVFADFQFTHTSKCYKTEGDKKNFRAFVEWSQLTDMACPGSEEVKSVIQSFQLVKCPGGWSWKLKCQNVEYKDNDPNTPNDPNGLMTQLDLSDGKGEAMQVQQCNGGELGNVLSTARSASNNYKPLASQHCFMKDVDGGKEYFGLTTKQCEQHCNERETCYGFDYCRSKEGCNGKNEGACVLKTAACFTHAGTKEGACPSKSWCTYKKAIMPAGSVLIKMKGGDVQEAACPGGMGVIAMHIAAKVIQCALSEAVKGTNDRTWSTDFVAQKDPIQCAYGLIVGYRIRRNMYKSIMCQKYNMVYPGAHPNDPPRKVESIFLKLTAEITSKGIGTFLVNHIVPYMQKFLQLLVAGINTVKSAVGDARRKVEEAEKEIARVEEKFAATMNDIKKKFDSALSEDEYLYGKYMEAKRLADRCDFWNCITRTAAREAKYVLWQVAKAALGVARDLFNRLVDAAKEAFKLALELPRQVLKLAKGTLQGLEKELGTLIEKLGEFSDNFMLDVVGRDNIKKAGRSKRWRQLYEPQLWFFCAFGYEAFKKDKIKAGDGYFWATSGQTQVISSLLASVLPTPNALCFRIGYQNVGKVKEDMNSGNWEGCEGDCYTQVPTGGYADKADGALQIKKFYMETTVTDRSLNVEIDIEVKLFNQEHKFKLNVKLVWKEVWNYIVEELKMMFNPTTWFQGVTREDQQQEVVRLTEEAFELAKREGNEERFSTMPLTLEDRAEQLEWIASKIEHTVRSRAGRRHGPLYFEEWAAVNWYTENAKRERSTRTALDKELMLFDTNKGWDTLCENADVSKRMDVDGVMISGYEEIRRTGSVTRRSSPGEQSPCPECLFRVNPRLENLIVANELKGQLPELPTDNRLQLVSATHSSITGNLNSFVQNARILEHLNVHGNLFRGSLKRSDFSPTLRTVSVVDNELDISLAHMFDAFKGLYRLKSAYWDENLQANANAEQVRTLSGLSSLAKTIQPEYSVIYGVATVKSLLSAACGGECEQNEFIITHGFCYEASCSNHEAVAIFREKLHGAIQDLITGNVYVDSLHRDVDGNHNDGVVSFSVVTTLLDPYAQKDFLSLWEANQRTFNQAIGSLNTELRVGCSAGAFGPNCEYVCTNGWVRHSAGFTSLWPECIAPNHCGEKCDTALQNTLPVCFDALQDPNNKGNCIRRMERVRESCPSCSFYDSRATDYEGTVSRTVTNKKCLIWNTALSNIGQQGDWNHNYCRNPTGMELDTAWCYVAGSSGSINKELCDVGTPASPKCRNEGGSCFDLAMIQFIEDRKSVV